MADMVISPSRPAGMSTLSLYWALVKPLPKKERASVANHDFVDDVDWRVGNQYYTEDGYKVKVITKERAFMGWMAQVKYSNGAVRLLAPNDFLKSVDAN